MHSLAQQIENAEIRAGNLQAIAAKIHTLKLNGPQDLRRAANGERGLHIIASQEAAVRSVSLRAELTDRSQQLVIDRLSGPMARIAQSVGAAYISPERRDEPPHFTVYNASYLGKGYSQSRFDYLDEYCEGLAGMSMEVDEFALGITVLGLMSGTDKRLLGAKSVAAQAFTEEGFGARNYGDFTALSILRFMDGIVDERQIREIEIKANEKIAKPLKDNPLVLTVARFRTMSQYEYAARNGIIYQ